MRYFAYFMMVLTIAVTFNSCKQKADSQKTSVKQEIRTLGVADFEKAIADTNQVVLVDVRTLKEYNEGHIKGAIQIDVKDSKFNQQCISRLPKDKSIAVYCRSGFRSKTAANILAEEGFKVINLRDGYKSWTEAGKETAK